MATHGALGRSHARCYDIDRRSLGHRLDLKVDQSMIDMIETDALTRIDIAQATVPPPAGLRGCHRDAPASGTASGYVPPATSWLGDRRG